MIYLCSLKSSKNHLETINEKIDGETFTENNQLQIKSSVSQTFQARKILRSKTFNAYKCRTLTDEYMNKSKLANTSFRSKSFQCTNKLMKDLLRNNNQKVNLDPIAKSISLSFTQVNPLFFKEQSSLRQISTKKLALSHLEDVVLDLEMSLIYQYDETFKVLNSYWQLSRQYLKCYIILPNDRKWNDKPIMTIPLKNISKIIIGKNTIEVLNQKHKITALIQIYINVIKSKIAFNFCLDLHYNKKLIQIKSKNKKTLIEVGIKNDNIGIAFIKAISFFKATPLRQQ